MKCPAYSNLRDIYLPNVNVDQCSVDDFYSLLNSRRDEVLQLSKFIYYAFSLRDEIVKGMQR